MADFDPYYQWLAIPPKDQPPNHYRLLGVELFESNAEAIGNAADQRMAHVRSFQTGRHADLSQKLLNEIAAAKVCLLSPEKKSAYDRELRRQTATSPPAPPIAPPPATAQRTEDLDFLSAPTTGVPKAMAKTKRRRSSDTSPIWLGLALFAGAAIVSVAGWFVVSGQPGKEVASKQRPSASTALAPTEGKPENPKRQEPAKGPARPAEPREGPPAAPPQDAVKSKSPADSAKPGEEQPESPEPEEHPKEKPPAAKSAAPSKEQGPAADASAGPKAKLAVPDEAALKRALASIRETYKDDYRAADKTALAKKLLQKADDSKSDATARFALLREAKKIAAEAFQGELAFKAIDALAGDYDVRRCEMKAEVLEQAAKKPRLTPDQRTAIANAALEVVDEAIAEDDFETARQVGKQAIQMARLSKDRELAQEILTKNKEVDAAAKAGAEAKVAMAALQGDPDDAAANSILGKYLCLTKGDWEKGLPILARGGNAPLNALAARDLKGAATAEEQVKLGDAWWAVHGRQRAAYWYEKAMPALKRLERDRVQNRIAGEPLGRRAVDLLAWVDAERSSAGTWGKWARNGPDVACIAFPPDGAGRQDATLLLPVEAGGQYDLLVSFTLNKGGAARHAAIVLDFPVGAHAGYVAIGESGGGLGNIDGKDYHENATATSKTKLVEGRRYALLLKVRLAGDSATVDVTLDNQAFVRWQGKESSLSNLTPHILKVPSLQQRFFLNTRSRATFHSAELRMVSGEAKLVR
jgi:hypothetical protein